MIRLGTPDISPEDISRVVAVLSSGALVQGPEVGAFEEAIADYLGVEHVIALSSCTTALEVSLRSLGIGRGDSVITSSYSWVATANAIELVGAKPVFVDIDPMTFNIDSDELEAVIHDLKRKGSLSEVKAIVPVHAFGYMADIHAVAELASDSQIPVVEDAACALGAQLDDQYAGTFGTIGCFSFHPLKSITTGEGGALVTSEPKIADYARSFRNHGQASSVPRDFTIFGTNHRMTDVMAALGRSQFERLPDLLKRRRQIVETYLDLLVGEVQLPTYDPSRHAAQSFVVRLPPSVDRSSLIQDLREQGIEVGSGTIAIPFTAAYRQKYGYELEDFPVLSAVADDALSLPLHTRLSDQDIEQVATTLLGALPRHRMAS